MNSRLDLTAPTAYQGPRTLLKEGPVTKSKSGRKLTMVLCNDIIVLVESRNLYRMVSSPSLSLPPSRYLYFIRANLSLGLIIHSSLWVSFMGMKKVSAGTTVICRNDRNRDALLGHILKYSQSHYMKFKLEKEKTEPFN